MKEHTWVKEAIDAPGIGPEDFWVCESCGASGGPVFPPHQKVRISNRQPFLADGTGLKLSIDCDVSKAQVETATYLREHYLSSTQQKMMRRSILTKKADKQ